MTLDDLSKLCDAATPTEWELFDSGDVIDPGRWSVWAKKGPRRVCSGSGGHSDGELIAALRNHAQLLIEVARAAKPICDMSGWGAAVPALRDALKALEGAES